MANKKISEFPVTTSLVGGDAFLINHLGSTSTISFSSLSATISNNVKTTPSIDITSISSGSTSYTFKIEDANSVLVCNNTSPLTATMPAGIFDNGTEIILIQKSAVVTLRGASGVTVGSNGNKFKTNGVNAGVCLIKIDTNNWVLGGNTTI